MKQNIKGKPGRWIDEFYAKRKFKIIVVANRTLSDEDVLLNVPQGMVLAPILFMKILDIDREVKESIVKCSVDYTSLKMIGSEED